MERQSSIRLGALEKLKSFRGMEKQKSFRGIMSLERRSRDSPGKRGDTPLHLAARSGSVAHAQRVLADLDRALVAEMAARQNQDGETPLYVAAEKGHAEVVREILKVSDVHTAGIKASNSFDAFHIAAKQGHLEVLKEMLQALPALAMTTNSVNATALDTAAIQGHVDIVNLLLETDASLARIARNNGKTVLHSAARMGHVEVVRSLLNKDPGIGLRTDKKGQTALHMASKGQNAEIVVELLKPDISVIHIEDNKGNRPLHVATRKRNIIIVQTLLSVEGIDVNAVNRSGETAFAIAEKMNNEELVNILKEAGGETAKQQVHPPNSAKQLKQTVSDIRHDVHSQIKQTRQTKMQVDKTKMRLKKLHRMGMQSQSAILPWSCVGDSRMDDMYIELDALECAVDGSKKPCNLKFFFLKFITKQFSDELKIGHGGCGLVYKGILPNRVIAVKKLLNNYTIDEKMFHQEVTSLMMAEHKNIVRLLGYCSHTEEKAIDVAGKIIMAEIRERLLCFEYVTNGSLENHITDELRGLEWYTRYQIIKGICEGLHHLHKEKHIIHLDLKPSNILLDDGMVPKISDFGLSRLDEKSHTLSAERLLSLGYCAPEYLQHGKRSAKSDIYSLGVIITELVTGSRGNPCITKVLRRWKHRWNKSAIDTQLWFKQVSTCLDLSLRCKHKDPTDRPNIWDIITDLNKMDNADARTNNDTECLNLENMLDIEPLEMRFPFELNKNIPGSIELTNDTDDYFAFRMSSISVRPYFICPFKGIVPPRSKCSVTIMLQPQERVPPQFPCKDEFSVQSTRVDMNITALDITEDMFHEELGQVVDEVTLKVVLDAPSITTG